MLSNLISLATSEKYMNRNMKHKLHLKSGSIYIEETQNVSWNVNNNNQRNQ